MFPVGFPVPCARLTAWHGLEFLTAFLSSEMNVPVTFNTCTNKIYLHSCNSSVQLSPPSKPAVGTNEVFGGEY